MAPSHGDHISTSSFPRAAAAAQNFPHVRCPKGCTETRRTGNKALSIIFFLRRPYILVLRVRARAEIAQVRPGRYIYWGRAGWGKVDCGEVVGYIAVLFLDAEMFSRSWRVNPMSFEHRGHNYIFVVREREKFYWFYVAKTVIFISKTPIYSCIRLCFQKKFRCYNYTCWTGIFFKYHRVRWNFL